MGMGINPSLRGRAGQVRSEIVLVSSIIIVVIMTISIVVGEVITNSKHTRRQRRLDRKGTMTIRYAPHRFQGPNESNHPINS